MSKNKTIRINKGYSETGASHSKKSLKGFTAKSGSPNEDINYELDDLRQRARVLSMSGGLALSALKTNRTNVIGCGLILKPKIDYEILGLSQDKAKAWQKRTEMEFALWAENANNCDAIGMNDYYKIQQLAFYSALMNGDSFTLLQTDDDVDTMHPYSLRLNLIEADRCATPDSSTGLGGLGITDGKTKTGNKITNGVELNKKGKAIAYYFRSNYPNEIGPNVEKTEWTRVEKIGKQTKLPNVVQLLADVERAGQYRGVPFLAPVIELLLQIRRYTDAELTAAVVESMFTAFIRTEARTDENPLTEVSTGEEPIPLNEDEYEMGPGNMVHLKEGEDVTFGDPKRPSGGFSQFVDMVATLIGSSLEISKEILLKEFNSSYSASRAALLEFWKLVKMRREWFVADWCRPIYERWMYEAVARGRINAPGFFDDPIKRMAWLGADFTGPSQGMLDPTKEITAEQMMCENGFSTRAESAIRLNGSEFMKNVAELKTENEALKDTITPEENQVLVSNVVKAGYIKNITGGNDAN